jgi:hypothetical protein
VQTAGDCKMWQYDIGIAICAAGLPTRRVRVPHSPLSPPRERGWGKGAFLTRTRNAPASAPDLPAWAGGTPYTAIIRRRCQCLDCAQVRIDKEYA